MIGSDLDGHFLLFKGNGEFLLPIHSWHVGSQRSWAWLGQAYTSPAVRVGVQEAALRTCRYNEFFCATSATFAVQARDCCLLKRDLKAFLNLK